MQNLGYHGKLQWRGIHCLNQILKRVKWETLQKFSHLIVPRISINMNKETEVY